MLREFFAFFICHDNKVEKRAFLLGNEEPDLVGDLAIFEIEYPNLEQRSIFAISDFTAVASS